MSNKSIYVAIAALVISLLVGVLVVVKPNGAIQQVQQIGGTVENFPVQFINGLFSYGQPIPVTITKVIPTTSTSTIPTVSVQNPFGSNGAICDEIDLTVATSTTNIDGKQYTPSLKFVVGTSTLATTYSANLLSSTTLATTTIAGGVLNSGVSVFRMNAGEYITATVGDAFLASSTYYALEPKIQFHAKCWKE